MIALTSLPIASVIVANASLASNNDMLGPPVMLTIASFAPLIDTSNNGDDTARFAASCALFSPSAIPIPISASPRSFMTELTSAKSRLIIAGIAIKSVIV